MKFNCPNTTCCQPLEVDDTEMAGIEFNCPICGQLIEIETDEVVAHEDVHGASPSSSRKGGRQIIFRKQNRLQPVLPKPTKKTNRFVVPVVSLLLLVGGGLIVWRMHDQLKVFSMSSLLPVSTNIRPPKNVEVLKWRLVTNVDTPLDYVGHTLTIKDEFIKKGSRILIVYPKLSSNALGGVPLSSEQLARFKDRPPKTTADGRPKKGGTSQFIIKFGGQTMCYLMDVAHFTLHLPDGQTRVAELICYGPSDGKPISSVDDIEIGIPWPLMGNEFTACFIVDTTLENMEKSQFQFKNYPPQWLTMDLRSQ